MLTLETDTTAAPVAGAYRATPQAGVKKYGAQAGMSRVRPIVVVALAGAALAAAPAAATASDSNAVGTVAAARQPAPQVVPAQIRKALGRPIRRMDRSSRPKPGRPQARAAGWYDYGRINVDAFCIGPGLQVSTPIVKALPGYLTQWVAIRSSVHSNTTTLSHSDWYYGIAAHWGAWLGLSGGGRFINATTQSHHDAPGFLHYLQPGATRVRLDVAWYSPTALMRHQIVYLNGGDRFNC
jgi:hypothetical protein